MEIRAYKRADGIAQLGYVPTMFEKRMRSIFGKSDDAEWLREHDERFDKADLSELADLCTEAAGQDRATWLRWLMTTTRGRSLAIAHKRQHQQQKGSDMSKEKFQEFCKSVSRNGTSLSEHSLTALASVAAMQRHPGLDASRAFAKVFGDPTASDEARDFWRAIAVAKGMVEVAGDDDATDSDAEVVTGQLRRVRERQRRAGTAHDFGESDESALEKLQAIAKRQQRDGETIEQSFTRAFTAPENVALARAERRQNGFIR